MNRLAAIALIALASSFATTPTPVIADEPPSRQQDVIYGRKFGTALTLDVFRPAGPSNGLGIVFVVSGGWFSSHDRINRVRQAVHRPGLHRLRRRPRQPAQVHHPRGHRRHEPGRPVHPASTPRSTAIDPDRLGICGASAGGHLSLMQGTAGDKGNPKANDPVDRESSRVAGGGLLLPADRLPQLRQARRGRDRPGHPQGLRGPVRLPRASTQARKKFVDVTDEAKIVEIGKTISPINHVSADDPPTLIIHGDADKLVPIQQAEIIVEKLKEAGVEAKLVVKPGAGHGWGGMDKDIAHPGRLVRRPPQEGRRAEGGSDGHEPINHRGRDLPGFPEAIRDDEAPPNRRVGPRRGRPGRARARRGSAYPLGPAGPSG